MEALIIFLAGLLIMNSDPQVPQIAKTICWIALVIFGIVLGALKAFGA